MMFCLGFGQHDQKRNYLGGSSFTPESRSICHVRRQWAYIVVEIVSTCYITLMYVPTPFFVIHGFQSVKK